MFISQRGNRSSYEAGGFTIVEMVVVLAILTMVTAASFAYLKNNDSEQYLRETATNLEAMAREAQARAIMTNTTHRIVMTGDQFRLLDADQYTKEADNWQTFVPRREFAPSSPDVVTSVIRWGTTKRVVPSPNMPIVWIFPPEGFVEPITIRFGQDNSYIQQTYHPLTASVADEEMEIQ